MLKIFQIDLPISWITQEEIEKIRKNPDSVVWDFISYKNYNFKDAPKYVKLHIALNHRNY